MNSRESRELDRHITGNWGEDQFKGQPCEDDCQFDAQQAKIAALVAALRDALSIMERSPKFKRANHPTYAEARCKAIDDARAALKAAESQS